MAEQVDPEEPYSCAQAELWDTLTLENFVDSKIWSKGEITLLNCLSLS